MTEADRLKLLLILATMPDEAWGWVLLALAPDPHRPNVWPDGIGGFGTASKAAIIAARDEAAALLKQAQG